MAESASMTFLLSKCTVLGRMLILVSLNVPEYVGDAGFKVTAAGFVVVGNVNWNNVGTFE